MDKEKQKKIAEKTVHFIMVQGPNGEYRVGNAYSSKEIAEGWLEFVSSAHQNRSASTEACTLYFKDGEITQESIKILDERYNMAPPKKAHGKIK